MYYEYKDKEIPLLETHNFKDVLDSKSKLFISDCKFIQNVLNQSNTIAFDFNKNKIECEAYFASLNAQIESIEEIISLLIPNADQSSMNYYESIITNLELEVTELNQSYQRESTLYSIQ